MHKHNVEPAKALTHPAFVAAATLLFFNDHLLKGSGLVPAWFTGKASDFAGLLVAPVVLAWCLRVRERRAFAVVHAVVGAVFAALEVSPAFTTSVAGAIDPVFSTHMVADLTDLIALPMLLVSFFVFGVATTTMAASRARALAGRLVGVGALLACCATSRAMPTPLATDGSRVITARNDTGTVAVDGKTGALERTFSGGTGEYAPVVVEGIVYGWDGSGIVGFELATGKKVFVSPVASAGVSLLGADVAYVYARVWREGNATFLVVDRRTGTQVSERPSPSARVDWAFVALSPGRYLMREEDVIAVHAPERRLFTLSTGEPSIVNFAGDDRRIVLMTDDGALLGFDATTGERVFDRPNAGAQGQLVVKGDVLGYGVETGFALARAGDGSYQRTIPVIGSVELDEGGLFAWVGNTTRVESWSLDGKRRWSTPVTIDEWFFDFVVTKDSVVLRDGDDRLIGLAKSDGKPAFTFTFDSVTSR